MLSTREVILIGLVDAVLTAAEHELPDELERLGLYVRHVRHDEELPDPMPPGWNRPAPASRGVLLGILGDVREAVEQDDSWEGVIEWSMPTDEPELESAEFGLIARYRIGNRDGQGGLRVYSPPERSV